MSETLDKTKKEYWEDLKVGSVVKLDDTQAMLESVEQGEGVQGIEFIIKEKRVVQETNDLCTWILFALNEEDSVFLIVKIVDDLIEASVFFEPEDFTPGTRKELVDNDNGFLFLEPQDDDYRSDYNLLKLTEVIVINEDEYSIKSQGIMLGTEGDSLYTISEYQCSKEVENPEIMIIEVGESKEGGYLTFLLGTQIQLNEVDILPV